MTIILRLQGLDVKASTADIRKFFERLHIPDGGVYIVGGILKEAFIAFTTERDAQLAMHYTGKFLKGSKVTLHISSIAELEHKLKSLLRKKSRSSIKRLTGKKPQQSPAVCSPSTAQPLDRNTANLPQPLYPNTAKQQTSPVLDCGTAFLLGVCTVLQGLQSSPRQYDALPGISPKADGMVFSEPRTPAPTLKEEDSRPGYIRIFGLPASTTKEDICHFFRGLSVKEAIVNVKLGLSRCCIVKFASMQDACNAVHFNHKPIGSVSVEVRLATEKMWTSALQECENTHNEERAKPCNSYEETVNHRKSHTSVLQLKRRAVNQLPCKAPKNPKSDSVSATLSASMEYIVMVRNLSKEMTKTEIKELFRCPQIAHNSVLHLLDKEGNRTDTVFLIFNCIEDYDYAMNLTGCHVASAAIEVSQITKGKMTDMMATTCTKNMSHQKMDILKKKIKNQVETSKAPPKADASASVPICSKLTYICAEKPQTFSANTK